MSKVQKEIKAVYNKLLQLKIPVAPTLADAMALRRAALTLHRWYEHECNGTIQRDEVTGKPYWHSTNGPNHGERISLAADRETGAMNTISRICRKLGLYHYLQADPRGGTLYVDVKPIPDNNYSRSTFIA